jgi:hypothetical protein
MNKQDGTGIQTKRQTQHSSTKNKMERSTASSRFSFHRTGPACPTSGYVHDDDDHHLFLLFCRLFKRLKPSGNFTYHQV